jgi:hypothetical protein
MDLAGSLGRSEDEFAKSTDIVLRARELRRQSESLRREAHRRRLDHYRLMQAVERRRQDERARGKPDLFVPSPWSDLSWRVLSDDFREVLVPVGGGRA